MASGDKVLRKALQLNTFLAKEGPIKLNNEKFNDFYFNFIGTIKSR